MKYEYKMPKLGHVMEEGTIETWEKAVGDTVKKGELLMTVETGKTSIEVDSPVDGVLTAILVEEGETVDIMTPIAVFEVE